MNKMKYNLESLLQNSLIRVRIKIIVYDMTILM